MLFWVSQLIEVKRVIGAIETISDLSNIVLILSHTMIVAYFLSISIYSPNAAYIVSPSLRVIARRVDDLVCHGCRETNFKKEV